MRQVEKCTLKWKMKPLPSVYPCELLQSPSSLPTPQTLRNPPRQRFFQEDELDTFLENDTISTLHDLNETSAPPEFQFKRFEDNVLYYNIVFDEQTQVPSTLESIKVDKELHVQLQSNGIPLPLPQWFVQGHNAKLKKISMLVNFPPHIKNTAVENQNSILEELNERQFYRPKELPPYSAEKGDPHILQK